MTEKKISFGFKQVKKQPVLLPNKIDNDKNNDVEMIQCLEGQTIKLMHEKEKEKLLVIPLLNSQKTSTALASLKNLKSVLDGDEPSDTNNGQNAAVKTESAEDNANLTLEQRVVKELLNEGKDTGEDDEANGEKLTLPMAADKLPLEGAKESTLDDYDDIPINQFGLAMLRGMGVKDEDIIAQQNKDPELRPKGMGLGADKVVKKVKLLVAPTANETLEIKKNAYVRILAGKNKDLYGQIEGLDDHACRVIVKLALGGVREALNEFMVQPVSKQEYQQYGKVINKEKYEEYKRKQEEKDLAAEKGVKQEIKVESGRNRESSEERGSKSRSHRESSPRRSRDRTDYASSSRQRDHDRKRSEERKRSPSYDRDRPKDVERSRNRNDSRRSRSVDKYSKQSSSSRKERSPDRSRNRSRERSPEKVKKRDRSTERSRHRSRERSTERQRNRSRDDKSRRQRHKSESTSSSDSDSSDDSRDKRHKKSKKKHKKKSSKRQDNSDDDRHHKRKTKKSKRERSRSRGRR